MGLRSLSALIGTLTIPAAWLAGRELVSKRAGHLTAALVALNPLLIWYSQEARSYALLVLFSTLALAFFARSVREPTPRALGLWAAASALALCSHYFAVFLIGPQLLWLVVTTPRNQRRRAFYAAGAVVAVGLALLPLAKLQEGEDRRNRFSEGPVAERVLEAGVDAFAGEEPTPFTAEPGVDVVQGVALAVGVLAVIGAVALAATSGGARERRGIALAGGVAATATVVPLLLALAGLDFAKPRNLIGGCVPLMAVLGIGFANERRRGLGIAGAVAVCVAFAVVIGAVTSTETMQRTDWRGAAEAAGQADEPRIVIVTNIGDDPMNYYLGARDLQAPSFPTREIVVIGMLPSIDPPGGFRLSFEGEASTLHVWRFVSRQPVPVKASEIGRRAVLPAAHPELMIDP